MFKVNNTDTRTKGANGVIPVSLLLNLNIFHNLLLKKKPSKLFQKMNSNMWSANCKKLGPYKNYEDERNNINSWKNNCTYKSPTNQWTGINNSNQQILGNQSMKAHKASWLLKWMNIQISNKQINEN